MSIQSYCPTSTFSPPSCEYSHFTSQHDNSNEPAEITLQRFTPNKSSKGYWKIEIDSLDIDQRIPEELLLDLQSKGLKDRHLKNFAKLCHEKKEAPLFVKHLENFFKIAIRKSPTLTGGALIQAMSDEYNDAAAAETFKEDRANALRYGKREMTKEKVKRCYINSPISSLMNSFYDCSASFFSTVNHVKKVFTTFLTAGRDDAQQGLKDVAVGANNIVEGGYDLFKALIQQGPFCHKFILDTGEFIKAVETFSRQALEYETPTLVLNVHSEMRSLNWGRVPVSSTTISDFNPGEPLAIALSKIPPHSRIVLAACSTGEGREKAMNIANAIANACPAGVTIIAPHDQINVVRLDENNKWELMIREIVENTGYYFNINYQIDRESISKCPKNKISFLNACSRMNAKLFKFNDNGNPVSFLNMRKKTYSLIKHPEETIQNLNGWGINNKDLYKISNAGMTLHSFVKKAARIREEWMSGSHLTDLVLEQ